MDEETRTELYNQGVDPLTLNVTQINLTSLVHITHNNNILSIYVIELCTWVRVLLFRVTAC